MEEVSRRVLIVCPSWLGDIILLQSLLQLIKSRDSSQQIDVIGPASAQSLLGRMGEITNTWTLPNPQVKSGVSEFVQIVAKIKQQHYSQAITLSQNTQAHLILFLARIPHRTGCSGLVNSRLLTDARIIDKKKHPLMMQRYLLLGLPKNAEILSQVTLPRLNVDTQNCEALMRRLQLFLEAGPVLVVCFDDGIDPSKSWPLEHYQEVIQKMIDQGWQVWVFDRSHKRYAAKKITMELQNPRCYDLSSAVNLVDMLDLMSVADQVLTCESSLMHIVHAIGVKSVVLCGCAASHIRPPLSSYAQTIKAEHACHPLSTGGALLGKHSCMGQIKPDEVVNAIVSTV